jgi:large subunit ribosomal protein L4e
MAHPLKTWRRWHRKVNLKQRRHALASALAATAIPALVMARGHRIMDVPQIPLILEDAIGKIEKTRHAVEALRKFGVCTDGARVHNTIRPGLGKLRNRRYKRAKGPLLITGDESANLVRAVRNIPYIETANVKRLNLLKLAPGGHIGRFVIWTKSAFESLNKHFGSLRQSAELKSGYKIQREVLTNSDIARLINSDEIQKIIRPKKHTERLHLKQRKNPLVNRKQLVKLNPYADERRELARKITKTKHVVSKAEKKTKRVKSNHAQTKLSKIKEEVQKHADVSIDEYNKIMADARNF